MSKLLAGLLIAVAAMAGIYAVAATSATTIAASFTTTETSSHSRSVEFATAVKRRLAEHRAARAKCALITGTEKKVCIAEARAEERRAVRDARQL